MRLTSILSATCAALVLVASAPAAAAWEPQGGAVFNNPGGTYQERWRILRAVDEAIRNAAPDSKIMISSFLMDTKSTADALLAAHDRGVAVQMVLDRHADTRQSRRVARRVNKDNIDPETGLPPVDDAGDPLQWGPDDSFVVICRYACRGPGRGINHAKFYVFTETGTAKNVVMVSSSNLNRGGALKGWNDLYTMKNKPAILRDFQAIHREMAEDTAPDGDRYREFVRGRFTTRFFPMTEDGDPRMADLSKVRCRGARDGAGRNGRTVINISMFLWKGTQGARLARRVVELDRLGCDVSVIYGAPDKEVRRILTRSARRGGIKLWNSRWDNTGDGVMDFRVHHKYMLVSGSYDGDPSSWRVHTGSLNWAGGLRANDENNLTVVGRGAYTSYLRNWNLVRRGWTHRVG
ncbi:MAG TPA: phospholipase D-like domain-containing protein [Nocardioidaceae bacterium]